jgi:isopenicillin N synthase-like dioxygenase
MVSLPVFNLGGFESSTGTSRKSYCAKLDKFCRETGFLLIENHAVPDKVIESQWSAVEQFFSQEPDAKMKVSVPYPGYPYGWIGPNKEALAASKGQKTPPDLKESFNGGPLQTPTKKIKDGRAYEFCYQPTIWPEIEGFKEAWTNYYLEMEKLAARIMSAFAEALNLEPYFFDKYLKCPISALRALYYPETTHVPEYGQQRAGAHTDYGSLTILLPQPETSGLQLKLNGKWIDVPTIKDTFVINIGDLMELWTGGRWISTLHRVVAKPNQPGRKSLAFFHQPDWEAKIYPINAVKNEPVISGPYLMEKFLSTGT